MNKPFLSIIIPTYNESLRLPQTVLRVKEFVQKQEYSSEVIIVDDGSTDLTQDLVKKLQKDFSELILIENTVNKGKGAVVKQGMLMAQGEWRLFTDADNSTDIYQVEKLLDQIDRAEVIIGSRYLKNSSIEVRQPFRRRVLSRMSNILIQCLILPNIKDTQCGFKLFSAIATEQIFPRQTMQGWSFDFELLAIARIQKFQIKEVAVNWHDAKNSNLRASRAALNSLKDLYTVKKRMINKFYES